MSKAYVFFVKEQGFDINVSAPHRRPSRRGFLYDHPAKLHLISQLYVNLEVAHTEIGDALGYNSTVDQAKVEATAEKIGFRLEQGDKLRQAVYFDPTHRLDITPAFVEGYVSLSRKNLDEIASLIEKPLDGTTKRNLASMLKMYDVYKHTNQVFPELGVQTNLGFPDNGWLFTFWFFVFQMLTKTPFPENLENTFSGIYGDDPLNLKKFYLRRILATVKRKLGPTAFSEIPHRENLRVALQVISTLGLMLNPLLAGSFPAPPEEISLNDSNIDDLLRESKASEVVRNENDLRDAAKILGLEGIVENYSKLIQLVRETLAMQPSPKHAV